MAENQVLDGINNVKFLKTFLCDQLRCKMEEIDFRNVRNFTLEHKNLLRINCLWPLSNLTHLSLANNRLKKIENLESLTFLRELNLSHNEISKIENLNTLININKLLLNSNRIQLLDNLDELKHLKILNVSSNCIKDTYFPFYLCQFKELQALIINDNPCYFQQNEIDEYLIALIPNLLDLNYIKISDREKYIAAIHHKMRIIGHQKNSIRDIEKPGRLFSKYKTLSKCGPDFWCITGGEFFDYLFQNFSILLNLSEDGENFQRLNDRLRKNLGIFFQDLQLKKTLYEEKSRAFKETLNGTDFKSSKAKKNLVSNLKAKLEGFSTEGEKLTEEYRINIRMSLLAEECDAHHQQQKVLNEMNNILSAEIQNFYDDMKMVHNKIEEEVHSYVKAMSKNIETCFQWKTNVPFEFQPASKESIFRTLNLNEFFAVFKGSCTALINEAENRHVEVIRDWKDDLAKIFRNNIIQHRKAVAEIIELMSSLKS